MLDYKTTLRSSAAEEVAESEGFCFNLVLINNQAEFAVCAPKPFLVKILNAKRIGFPSFLRKLNRIVQTVHFHMIKMNSFEITLTS